MNLCWILSGPLEQRAGRPFSANASHRLRCLEPAAALGKMGRRVAVLPIETLAAKPDSPTARDADVVVVAKQFAEAAPLIRRLKERGAFIVVDLCDDVFTLDHLRPVYAGLLAEADAVTAASATLAERAAHRLSCPVAVVPDCVEGAARAPAFAPPPDPADPIRLLWFGQPANLDALDSALPGLGRLARPLTLTIVTRPDSWIAGRFPDRRDGLSIRRIVWSPEAMRRTLEDCHLVVLPSDAINEKLVKSPNRVMTALWAGRLPVAFPLPSCQPFADSAILNERLEDGVAQALSLGDAATARIALGQDAIRRAFTPQATARRWLDVLEGFLSDRRRASP
jgi:glycosyltransferase involved in cell wall biosynthesis